MPKPSAAELAELRRRAYHYTPEDLAAALDHLGLPPDLMPLQVAARVSSIRPATLRWRIRQGRLYHVHSGIRVLVRLSDVLELKPCCCKSLPFDATIA